MHVAPENAAQTFLARPRELRARMCKGIGLIESPHLTKFEADGGYAPRFLAVFAALSFLRFDGESALPPTAANTHR